MHSNLAKLEVPHGFDDLHLGMGRQARQAERAQGSQGLAGKKGLCHVGFW